MGAAVSLPWANISAGSARHATGAATAAATGFDAFAAGWAAWVRAAGSAKEVARQFGASPRTVEGWRDGGPPLVRHLVLAVGLWGRPFLEEVFAPLLTADDGDLMRRLERVRADMEFLLREAEALRDAETAAGMGGAGAPGDAGACAGLAMARGPGAALARPGRAVVAVLVLAAVTVTAIAHDQDDQARLRGRSGRPAVVRVVGRPTGGGRGWA